jgi:UDP-galactopyranose mutase
MRSYQELPAYLAGWDVALLPFARNESTRFISPTKTPEYLAGGKPVVSTPIQDVITLYGQTGFVQIAAEPAEFIEAVEVAYQQGSDPAWLDRVDCLLAGQSWDHTWAAMQQLIDTVTVNQRGYPEHV